MKRNSGLFSCGLIWFGAAISVAEIEAGIEAGANWSALILGHLLGGAMLFAAGLIGARQRQGAMATTTSAFGTWGARFFALLNVIQLVGWIAVMNEQATAALSQLQGVFDSWVTHIVLSALVGVWVIVGILRTSRLATVAMTLLALLTAYLSWKLCAGVAGTSSGGLAFWPAFELSAAMPLSWVPVIADYTKDAVRPVAASAVSTAVYTVASLWMYALGILIGQGGEGSTLAAAITVHGLALVGVPILVVSTVTTNLLAAHSSGESACVVSSRFNAKIVVALVCAGGAALSITGIAGHYIHFLYFIASVFAPMAAVLVVSHFLVKRQATLWNVASWLVGFIAYHVCSAYAFAPTVVSLALSAALALMPRVAKVFCNGKLNERFGK